MALLHPNSIYNFTSVIKKIRAGLSIQITGRGMFSCFLPLMNILGGIIELHHARNIARINPIYQTSSLDHLDHRVHELREQLDTYIQRLQEIQSSSTITIPSQSVPSSYSASVQYPRRNLATDIDRTGSTGQSQQYVASFGTYSTPAKEAYVGDFYWEVKLVYCTYFAYVLHIILAGKWDPVELLDDENVWTSSSTVMASASHAISAAEALEKIFRLDPDLRFMPTFFAVYLLHGSMLLLSIADKLQHTNGDGRITRAYQITTRGHEIFATRANTEYQRNLLKYLRIATMQVNGENLHPITDDERLQMRKILKMHRWNGSGVGLAS